MNRLFLSTAMSTFLIAGTTNAATFEFTQTGFNGNGVLSGFFEGEDLNQDGQITSGFGEVTAGSATFSATDAAGESFVQEFDFSSLLPNQDRPSFDRLVFDLDGGGTIGDGIGGFINDPSNEVTLFRPSEALVLSNADFSVRVGEQFEIDAAVGCQGSSVCGTVSRNFEPPVIDFEPELDFPRDERPVIDVSEFAPLFSTTEILNVVEGPNEDPNVLGSADNPFLPVIDDDGPGFLFTIEPDEVPPVRTFFFDPVVAVGYTYEITGTNFFSVTAPTTAQVADADGAYTLTVNGATSTILAGETVIFGAQANVTEFTIEGIDLGLALDPNDPTAFLTGVAVTAFTGSFDIRQTPITFDTGPDTTSPVPLPASFLLLGSVLGVLGASRRRRKA